MIVWGNRGCLYREIEDDCMGKSVFGEIEDDCI